MVNIRPSGMCDTTLTFRLPCVPGTKPASGGKAWPFAAVAAARTSVAAVAAIRLSMCATPWLADPARWDRALRSVIPILRTGHVWDTPPVPVPSREPVHLERPHAARHVG